jgi:hypothetical protein
MKVPRFLGLRSPLGHGRRANWGDEFDIFGGTREVRVG